MCNLSIKQPVLITKKISRTWSYGMERDSVYSAIERRLTNRVIHLPCNYISAILEARASNSYEVIQNDHNFVKNYADTTSWIYKFMRPGR